MSGLPSLEVETLPPRKREPRPSVPRRRRDDQVQDGALGAVAYFVKSLGNPQDIKSTLAFLLAVATTVWAVAGIQGTVAELKPQVAELRVDVKVNEQDIARQDGAIEQHDRELESLKRDWSQLNKNIRRAVEAGVQRGVARALREIQQQQ